MFCFFVLCHHHRVAWCILKSCSIIFLSRLSLLQRVCSSLESSEGSRSTALSSGAPLNARRLVMRQLHKPKADTFVSGGCSPRSLNPKISVRLEGFEHSDRTESSNNHDSGYKELSSHFPLWEVWGERRRRGLPPLHALYTNHWEPHRFRV